MNLALPLGIAGLVGLASSAAVYAAAVVTLVRLRRTHRGEPLAGFAPPVSIIKPLAGLDEGLEENLGTFFRLDYETYEIIFSFARKDDPAYRVARRVADRYTGVRATFVFDEREPGGNAKVNRLSAASRYVRHHHVLFSDGNVRVRTDFLRRAVSWFRDPRVGLVSHLFRGVGASSLGSRVESLYLNGCLMPGTAFIAAVLRRPCVVGKSILVSRQALDAIGGIGALRDYLAEDYVLGRQVRRAGFRVVLSTDVLDTVEVSKPLRTVWLRHRRWGMMRKRLAGSLYGGELLASALPWFVVACVAPSLQLRWAAALLLAVRWGMEILLTRPSGEPIPWRDALLLPLRDLGAAAVFWAGAVGRVVAWRGRVVEIGRETRIRRTAA
jgi:ceramide glucosyltransferase